MKRTDIKMTPAIARNEIKRLLPALHEELGQAVQAGEINRYQANQRLLVFREYLDLIEKMVAKDVSFPELRRILDDLAIKSRGVRQKKIF